MKLRYSHTFQVLVLKKKIRICHGFACWIRDKFLEFKMRQTLNEKQVLKRNARDASVRGLTKMTYLVKFALEIFVEASNDTLVILISLPRQRSC